MKVVLVTTFSWIQIPESIFPKSLNPLKKEGVKVVMLYNVINTLASIHKPETQYSTPLEKRQFERDHLYQLLQEEIRSCTRENIVKVLVFVGRLKEFMTGRESHKFLGMVNYRIFWEIPGNIILRYYYNRSPKFWERILKDDEALLQPRSLIRKYRDEYRWYTIKEFVPITCSKIQLKVADLVQEETTAQLQPATVTVNQPLLLQTNVLDK